MKSVEQVNPQHDIHSIGISTAPKVCRIDSATIESKRPTAATRRLHLKSKTMLMCQVSANAMKSFDRAKKRVSSDAAGKAYRRQTPPSLSRW